jgi:HAD superfamily hydrolase (TIGR01549 family)
MLGTAAGTDDTRRRPYFAALLDNLAVDPHTAEQVIERLDAAHKHDNLWRLMMPSTPSVLRDLRARGFTLGVVSNSDGRIVDILRKCGILAFFDVVIDSHEVGVEKPDPGIFHLALTRVERRAGHAAYVGDIYGIDVVGAERAGLRPLLLDTLGCYNDVGCTKIRHLRELLAIL